jgi:hypothetical protein
LRLAARTRGLTADELPETPEEEIAAAVGRVQETRPTTPKQACATIISRRSRCVNSLRNATDAADRAFTFY